MKTIISHSDVGLHNSLINKGEIFPKFLEHDPEAVQGGPVIERLLDETLRKGWCVFSFTANISYPGCMPMGLHQDQGAINPFQTPEAPVDVTTMYILEDVDERNGTLIVPTSHKLIPAVGSGNKVGKLPPTIHVEAPAGTVLLFDGRLLHDRRPARVPRQPQPHRQRLRPVLRVRHVEPLRHAPRAVRRHRIARRRPHRQRHRLGHRGLQRVPEQGDAASVRRRGRRAIVAPGSDPPEGRWAHPAPVTCTYGGRRGGIARSVIAPTRSARPRTDDDVTKNLSLLVRSPRRPQSSTIVGLYASKTRA